MDLSHQRIGLSVNTHQKTSDRLRDHYTDKSRGHSKDSTMALEIPSMNSTDLNNIVFKLFNFPTCGQQFRSPVTTSVVVESPDTELSPEPRTPQFSSTTGPTFRESNKNFGFTFPIPTVLPPQSLTTNAQNTPSVSNADQPSLAQASQVTNDHLNTRVCALGDQSQGSVDTEVNVQGPVELMTRSAESPVGLQASSLTSCAVKGPFPEPSHPTNIPTTVLESVQLTNEGYPQTPNPQDMPRVLVRGEDGKTASFIRFLNDPIPLPDEMEYRMLNVEGYRPPEGSIQHGTDAPVDNNVIADIDAIQRMEEEPPGEASETVQTTHQAVQYIQCEAAYDEGVGVESNEVQDDAHINGQVVYYEIPNECQAVGTESQEVQDHTPVNGQVVYYEIPNDCEEAMEVAAYQSVDEDQNASDVLTYTELTPRTQPPPLDQTQLGYLQEQQDPQAQPEVRDEESQEATEALTQTLGEKYTSTSDEAKQAFASAFKEKSVRPLLKMELKNKIQLKRLKEGKGELKVTFEDRPIGEPTEEEKVKASTRKQKNRESAVRSRKKREEHIKSLEKTVKELVRDNKQLSGEIAQLKVSIAQDLQEVSSIGCSCFTTNTNATNANVVTARDASTKSLQEAIRDVLASEHYEFT